MEEPVTNLVTMKSVIDEEHDTIQANMTWQNYDLNETVVPLVQLLKDHAVQTLIRTYGKVMVDKDEIFDLFIQDVFTYFPLLMQELAITRLIDGYSVDTYDQDSTTFTRSEKLNTQMTGNVKTDNTANLNEGIDGNSTQKDTGTVKDNTTASGTQSGETKIVNGTNVTTSNTHNVQMTKNLPEQALDSTGHFPIGEDGAPDLGNAYVQGAAEQYSVGTPILTDETSTQNTSSENSGTNDTTRTNNLTSTNTSNSNRNTTSTGSDKTDSTQTNIGDNVITERTDIKATNKQYSYEITNFLTAASTVVAFSNFEDRFYWLRGLI